MSKKLSFIVVGLILLGSTASLLAINSFFRENTRLLQEQKRLINTNNELIQTVESLKRQIPPVPKGAVVEDVTIEPLPDTEGTEAPRYTVAFWIKNPTNQRTEAIQGLIAAQTNGILEPSRWSHWLVNMGPLEPGERKHVVTNPVSLGNPGTTVEVLVTLKGEPGIGKASRGIPAVIPPPKPVAELTPPASEPRPSPRVPQRTTEPSTPPVTE